MKVGNPEVGKVGTKKGVKKVEEVHNGRRLVGYEVLKVGEYKTLGGFIRAAKAALKAVGLDPEEELSALGNHNDGAKAWDDWTLLDDLKATGRAEYHAAGDGFKYGFEFDFDLGRIYAYNLEEVEDQDDQDQAPGYGVTYEPDGSKVYHYKSGWKVRVKPEPRKAEPREEVAVVEAGDEEEAKKAALRLVGVEDRGVILGVEDVTGVVFAAIDAAEMEADAAALDAPEEVYNEEWIKAFRKALKKRGWVLVAAFELGPIGPVYVFSRRLGAVFKITWEDGRRYIELPRYLPDVVKEELLKLSLGGAL